MVHLVILNFLDSPSTSGTNLTGNTDENPNIEEEYGTGSGLSGDPYWQAGYILVSLGELSDPAKSSASEKNLLNDEEI